MIWIILGAVFLALIIWGVIKSFKGDKITKNRITSVLGYHADICGTFGDTLYDVIGENVFLSVDKKMKRLCIIKQFSAEEQPTHEFIEGFSPTQTLVAGATEIDPRITTNIFDREVLYVAAGSKGFSIDEENMKICLLSFGETEIKHKIIGYNDLLAGEIVEDGISVTKTSRSSQVGGALVGGLLLGGAGAIIGGLSGKKTTSKELDSISLRLTINDLNEPILDYRLNNKSFKGDPQYQKSIEELARHWHAVMGILIRRADQQDTVLSGLNSNNNNERQ